ncbi:hypothetical protein T439DRAFT_354110 [Meredithblackwellia eburnea MCA 4105]
MPDTDYSDLDSPDFPPPTQRRRGGTTYGRKGKGTRARSSAPTRQPERKKISSIEPSGGDKTTTNTLDTIPQELSSDVAREMAEEADEESADEDEMMSKSNKRRKLSSGTTTTIRSAPLRQSMTNPSPIKLANPVPRSGEPNLTVFKPLNKLKRSASTIASSSSAKIQPPRAPTSSPRKSSADQPCSPALLRVGISVGRDGASGRSSESDSGRRVKKKDRDRNEATEGPRYEGRRSLPGSSTAAKDVGQAQGKLTVPGSEDDINMDVDAGELQEPGQVGQVGMLEDIQNVTSPTEVQRSPVADAESPTIVESPDRTAQPSPHPISPVKKVLGDKSNLPSPLGTHHVPSSPQVVRARSAQPSHPQSGLGSPFRSQPGTRTSDRQNSTSRSSSSRIAVLPDHPGRASSLRGTQSGRSGNNGLTRTRTAPTHGHSRSQSSLNLQSLSAALPESVVLPASSSPLLVPRANSIFDLSASPSRLRASASASSQTIGLGRKSHVSLGDLELDDEEMQEVYKPPRPDEGSVILKNPVEMDDSIVLESYDGDITAKDENSKGDEEEEENEEKVEGDTTIKTPHVASVSDLQARPNANSALLVDKPSVIVQLPTSSPPSAPPRAFPKRHMPPPIDCPTPGGPDSDEDDLAYAIRTTASGEGDSSIDDEDEEEFEKNEKEIGKSLRSGGRIGVKVDRGRSRRSRFLRQIMKEVPRLEEGDDSEDELRLIGTADGVMSD